MSVDDIREDEEDVRLVHRALRGDLSAFEKVVRRHQKGIYYFCLSSLKDPEEAEEAAQEVFLRAYRSLHTFSLNKRFKTWLYAIAVNQVRSRWRRAKNVMEKLKRLFEGEPKKESEEGELRDARDPETITLETLEAERVRKAVEQLPESLRDVVVLYYFEELSVAEVAETLQLGEEGVKTRLFRARKALRKMLESS